MPRTKKIRQVSSWLDISHHQSLGGDRPEKGAVNACVHTRPSVTRPHTLPQKARCVFYHRPSDTTTGNAQFEYEWLWKGGRIWMQCCFLRESNNCGFYNWICFSLACHAVFSSPLYCAYKLSAWSHSFFWSVWSEFADESGRSVTADRKASGTERGAISIWGVLH